MRSVVKEFVCANSGATSRNKGASLKIMKPIIDVASRAQELHKIQGEGRKTIRPGRCLMSKEAPFV